MLPISINYYFVCRFDEKEFFASLCESLFVHPVLVEVDTDEHRPIHSEPPSEMPTV